jgi:hypothetical protein
MKAGAPLATAAHRQSSSFTSWRLWTHGALSNSKGRLCCSLLECAGQVVPRRIATVNMSGVTTTAQAQHRLVGKEI